MHKSSFPPTRKCGMGVDGAGGYRGGHGLTKRGRAEENTVKGEESES